MSLFCLLSILPIFAQAYEPILAEYKGKSMPGSLDELPELVKIALSQNSKIRAAHDRWIAEAYTVPQARSLPDPVVNFGFIDLIGNDPFETPLQGLQNIGGAQEIPFPGKLYAQWKIAKASTKKAYAAYRTAGFKVVAQLKRKYFQLYFTNRAIEIYTRNRKIIGDMVHLAETRRAQGSAPEQDILRGETEILRLDARLVILEQKRESLIADINEILERDLEVPVKTPNKLKVVPLHYSKKELDDLLLQHSPGLSETRQEMRKSKREILLSQMNYFPDVNAEADKLKDIKLDANGYSVFFTFSFPLYFLDKQNNAVREAAHRYNAAAENYEDLYYDLAYRVRNAILIIERADKLIRLFQNKLLPQAKATFLASEKAYKAGEVDFYTFLNNLLTLQDNELDLELELVRREKRIADIEKDVGIFL